MIDALTTFINSAGWLAPLYYVFSFVLTALLPVVPTPLVAALGGTVFGYGPAVVYGIFGLGLGALVSLTLARAVGRPLLRRMVKPEVWVAWEQLLGIRSVAVWGLIFLVLNLDFAVTIAGLTTLPILHLWVAAMIARVPWLLASAWFGDAVLVNDGVVLMIGLLMIPGVYLLGRLRNLVQAWLISLSPDAATATVASEVSQVAQPRIEDVTDGVPEKVEAHH
ncbi:MAG: VTT domain-containing protein [Trueperaceae bacterium]